MWKCRELTSEWERLARDLAREDWQELSAGAGSNAEDERVAALEAFATGSSAQFLKYGNKRDGDSGGDPWADVPTPRAWRAG
jgi:hypothetical protein